MARWELLQPALGPALGPLPLLVLPPPLLVLALAPQRDCPE